MAKSEGRGWKSYIPTVRGVVKIFIVLAILRAITRFLVAPNQAKLPAIVRDNWPNV